MCCAAWMLPAAGVPQNQTEDPFFKSASCPPASKCWEASSPFRGGSVPWKGTAAQQERAERAKAARRAREPDSVWTKCHEKTCPQYSSSGAYEIHKYRPACAATAPAGYRRPRDWCWEDEGQLLPLCGAGRVPAYECPPPAPPARALCPLKPRAHAPLFSWSSGVPFANFADVPYPPDPEDAPAKCDASPKASCPEAQEEKLPPRAGQSKCGCPGPCAMRGGTGVCTSRVGADECQQRPPFSCAAAFPDVPVCEAAAAPCTPCRRIPCICPVDELLTVRSFREYEALVGRY